MSREIIQTERAPQAIGTYSQAVRCGNTVYLSGQIPLVPETMELVEGDMQVQIRRVFDNLSAVAEAAGGSLADVAKLNVFLPDLGHFAIVNEVMAEYFTPPGNRPAPRSTPRRLPPLFYRSRHHPAPAAPSDACAQDPHEYR